MARRPSFHKLGKSATTACKRNHTLQFSDSHKHAFNQKEVDSKSITKGTDPPTHNCKYHPRGKTKKWQAWHFYFTTSHPRYKNNNNRSELTRFRLEDQCGTTVPSSWQHTRTHGWCQRPSPVLLYLSSASALVRVPTDGNLACRVPRCSFKESST
jgi:hypothetical protein